MENQILVGREQGKEYFKISCLNNLKNVLSISGLKDKSPLVYCLNIVQLMSFSIIYKKLWLSLKRNGMTILKYFMKNKYQKLFHEFNC